MKIEKSTKNKMWIGTVGASVVLAFGVFVHEAWEQDRLMEQKTVQIEKLKEENTSLTDEVWTLKNKLQDVDARLKTSLETITSLETNSSMMTEQINKLKTELQTKLNGKTYVQTKVFDIKASAYSQSDEEDTADGITFTETKVQDNRTVAVDPNIIPLGSLLYIESDSPLVGGFYVAEDIGGAIKGNRIDIFMSDRNKCFEFGKQQVKVTVLKELGK